MFDLQNYMTAEERIELFKLDHPEMRYDTEHGVYGEFIWVKALLYRFFDDPLPCYTGLAMESMKIPFALEKAETSSYARAITNSGDAKYSTTKDGTRAPRANRAEMEQVVRIEADLSENWEEFMASETIKPLAAGVSVIQAVMEAAVIPECAHGQMLYKQGSGADGPYSGYVCTGKRGDQCKAKWDKKK